ncbi:MAG: helix-turn-helix transcriptional regulator [Chloroflexota bacterium]|nr:helix-turn-helix transcriptional regulator [Chloroflexota bacterium]
MLEAAEQLNPDSRPFVLSPRETEVLQMTSQGLTNVEIARQMNVTVHAVKFHLSSVYRKLGVANRTEAAVMFLQKNAREGRDGESAS